MRVLSKTADAPFLGECSLLSISYADQYAFVTNLDGHYFSAYYQTAKHFALQKLGKLKAACAGLQKKNQVMTAEPGLLYSVLICQVRNVSKANNKYVINDKDILPCYFAIVCHGNGLVANPEFERDTTLFI
ncbi:hypothetical protein BGX30_010869 [Mortierella sp. GBA39]|nr:hypothetical protein BGX30_010869 [Mortierella sp. GBA39]